MDIKAAFTQLHFDLRNHDAIQIIENKNSFASIRQDKYLQRIEMKLGLKLPKELEDTLMVTYSNSMNYHYHIDGIPTGQGAWNLTDAFEFIKSKPEATSLIGQEDQHLVIIDQPDTEEDIFAAYIWNANPNYLPADIYFYKKGNLVKTSLSFKAYIENIVHFMGALHWPLLFTDVDPDHHSFEFEFMKLNQNFSELQSIFPNRDWTVFGQQLKKKGLR